MSSLRVNQNIMAIRTHGALTATSARVEKSVEKLSTGLRINRAADDAAGLTISEKLRRQIRGLSRAILNAQDGISMIQAGEGALNESHAILHRMRELAIQASNDTLTTADRLEIQKEISQLRDDLNRIANNTEFNTKKLLDGSQSAMVSASSSYVEGISTDSTDAAGDFAISLVLKTAGIAEMQRSQIMTVLGRTSTILAQGSTKLEDVAQFYDANGAFALETQQLLTVNGNSRSAQVVMNRQMTLDELAAGIQEAIIAVDEGLGMVNSSVGFVTTAQTGIANLGGYLEFLSGRIGETGRIGFSGDQTVITALGMQVSREAKNNVVDASSKDNFGNSVDITRDSNRLTGLIKGIDLVFDSQPAQIAGTKGIEKGLHVETAFSFTVTTSVAGAAVSDRITIAAGDWTMNGLARTINGQRNNISVVLQAEVVSGQIKIGIEPANPSDPSRFTVTSLSDYSNVVGINEGTFNGFLMGNKNTDYERSGLSEYNEAISVGHAVVLSVYDGVTSTAITLYNTFSFSTVSLAPDMVTDTSIVQILNAGLTGLAVRADVVADTIALTSTRIGRLNNNGIPISESKVIILGIDAQLKDQIGMSAGSATGVGDTNFNIHIVNNHPQYQIGADQGQTMSVAFAAMTAEALEVSNLDLTTIAGAQRALSRLNKAIDLVSAERSKLGAFQNRLEYAINNLRNTHSNLSAAESRIRDVDMANEMIEFTRDQIVSQSGMAMLAQANSIPQGVLQLLQ